MTHGGGEINNQYRDSFNFIIGNHKFSICGTIQGKIPNTNIISRIILSQMNNPQGVNAYYTTTQSVGKNNVIIYKKKVSFILLKIHIVWIFV